MAIIGNQKAVKLLDKIVETGKIANAYLFSGPEHVGKFTAALEFARKLALDPAKNLEQASPNLIIIAPEAEEKKGVIKKLGIKIEAIRDLQHKLSLSSEGSRYKVVIIDEAERLNKTAQNALLKTLEEPNEKVVLVLVAQDENKILPTIRSRCQKISFGLVDDSEIGKMIPGDRDRRDILFWSLGRPGLALDLIHDPENLSRRKEAFAELSRLFSQDAGEKFKLAEEMGKDSEEMLKTIDLWIAILREDMLGKNPRLHISRDKAFNLITAMSEAAEILKSTNANPRLVLENIFLQF